MRAVGEGIQSGGGRARDKMREALIQVNIEVLVSDSTREPVRCSLAWGVGTGRAYITVQRWPHSYFLLIIFTLTQTYFLVTWKTLTTFSSQLSDGTFAYSSL